jgi:ribosomal protein S18 acetylase RimI-like enzyme
MVWMHSIHTIYFFDRARVGPCASCTGVDEGDFQTCTDAARTKCLLAKGATKLEHSHDEGTTLAALSIRPYQESDEQDWLRCSVLSFLYTSYFDSVYRTKPQYEHPAIELVAESNGMIVGVIDVEYESTPGSVCTVCEVDNDSVLGGMIWHLAVHPDFQRRGIGKGLLHEAQTAAIAQGVTCFEAWTRDDVGTLRWYETHGFQWVKRYLHVYMQEKNEIEGALVSSISRLRPVHVFAHYMGDDHDGIRTRFERVHDCNCFRLRFSL